MRPLLKILFITLLFAAEVSAQPTVNIIYTTYAISGVSAEELREHMNSKSNIRRYGKTFDALTSWNVNWRFNWNTKNSKCYITTASSTVDVTFTLPKWTNRDMSSRYLINKWDRYYDALTQHENGHKDFGIKAAEEIEQAILEMPSRISCKILESEANEIGKRILKKYMDLEKEYDENTNHGSNDGAVFP